MTNETRGALAVIEYAIDRGRRVTTDELVSARKAIHDIAELVEADRKYDAAVVALYYTKGAIEAHRAQLALATAKARRLVALAPFLEGRS